jgi:hypothetical protein
MSALLYQNELQIKYKFIIQNVLLMFYYFVSDDFYFFCNSFIFSVIRPGFEPGTHSLEGCCSIQLSYRTILKCGAKVVLLFDFANALSIFLERIVYNTSLLIGKMLRTDCKPFLRMDSLQRNAMQNCYRSSDEG